MEGNNNSKGKQITKRKRTSRSSDETVQRRQKEHLQSCEVSFRDDEQQIINRSSCVVVRLPNLVGILSVKDIWKEEEDEDEEEIYLKGKLFLQPGIKDERHGQEPYGEDELLEYHRDIVVSKSELEQLCLGGHRGVEGLKGTNFYSYDDIIRESINATTYFKLKHPKRRLKSSVSAVMKMKTLGKGISRNVSYTSDRNLDDYQARRIYKLVVVDYKEYCLMRELKAGLETSLPVARRCAKSLGVVNEIPSKVFFSRYICSNNEVRRLNGKIFHLDQLLKKRRVLDEDTVQDEIDFNLFLETRYTSNKVEERLTNVKVERPRI